MLAAKAKSGLSEGPNNKTIPATPKVSKINRNGSTKSESGSPPVQKLSSPLPKSRASIERSPKSVESKLSSKATTTPDKPPRTAKGSELQAKLDVLEEDLKKAKEQLISIEQEKIQAIEELNQAKRLVEEANEKLQEAIVAKQRAEEISEIEKFRADELEQAGIETAQKREEEHQKMLESIRSQHALDASELHSTSQELQKVKLELANAIDVKKTALSQADEAKKTAEMNGEKVEILSTEIIRLKALLDSEVDDMNKVKIELANAIDAKNKALSQADDARKTADMYGEKVELLSAEIIRLKALLDSKMDSMNKEAAEIIKKLDAEIYALKLELERAKSTEEELVEKGALIEQLRLEVLEAKNAESHALELVDEWKKKSALLEDRLEEAKMSEKSAVVSLATAIKKLEESGSLLQDAEMEIAVLKDKVGFLEIEVNKYKNNVEESDRNLDLAQQEAMSLGKTIELLKSEFQKLEEEKLQVLNNEMAATKNVDSLLEEKQKLLDELMTSREEGEKVKKAMEGLVSALHEMSDEAKLLKSGLQKVEEEKLQALNNEKIAAKNVETLSEENKKLMDELNTCREEGEKVKKAMENLASALHEMSVEARENQERILTKQAEIENANVQIEQLNLTIKNLEEKYEVMLDETRYEIICLKKTVERFETEASSLNTEWDKKELNFINIIKKSEDELASVKAEMAKVADLVKVSQQEAQTAEAEGAEMLSKLRQAESLAASAHGRTEEAKAESLQLKERLLDKENELQSIIQENDDLRIRESAAQQKIKELSALLGEATANKAEENGKLSSREKEGLLHEKAREISKSEVHLDKPENHHNDNQKLKEENKKEDQHDEEEDSQEIRHKDLATDRDHEAESIDDDLESKLEGDSYDQTSVITDNTGNEATSPTKQHQQQKKKKALLQKFGSLLKKKGSKG